MNPRAARFAVAIMAALSLQGCATMRAAGPGLIDCAAPMMSTLTADVLGQVGGAVRGDGFAGHAVLDGLLAQLGPAVICAARKIALEGGAQPQAADSGPDPVRLQMAERAGAWLLERRFRVRGAP